jgi:hypothetical protein
VPTLENRTETILDIASTPGSDMAGVIVMDRQGGFRMMDGTGWSLTGLAAEFGAECVFRIERRAAGVRVEGRKGLETCLLERRSPAVQPLARAFEPRFPRLAIGAGSAAQTSAFA